jgi:hypothetical protein
MDDYFFVFKHFDGNSGINHSMIIGMAIEWMNQFMPTLGLSNHSENRYPAGMDV